MQWFVNRWLHGTRRRGKLVSGLWGTYWSQMCICKHCLGKGRIVAFRSICESVRGVFTFLLLGWKKRLKVALLSVYFLFKSCVENFMTLKSKHNEWPLQWITNREQFFRGIQLLSPVQSETWKTWSGVFTEHFEWGGEIKVTPVFSYSLIVLKSSEDEWEMTAILFHSYHNARVVYNLLSLHIKKKNPWPCLTPQ